MTSRWYRLKGQNLRKSADGDSPRLKFYFLQIKPVFPHQKKRMSLSFYFSKGAYFDKPGIQLGPDSCSNVGTDHDQVKCLWRRSVNTFKIQPLLANKCLWSDMRRPQTSSSSRWRSSRRMRRGWRMWRRAFPDFPGKSGGSCIQVFVIFKSLLPFLLYSAVLSWEDPFKSTYALITYILVVLYMELWALPILPILLLLFHGFHRKAGTKTSGQ